VEQKFFINLFCDGGNGRAYTGFDIKKLNKNQSVIGYFSGFDESRIPIMLRENSLA
jgi:hypothetical protein